MTCQACGRPAENGVPTHWLGCGAIRPQDFEEKRVAADPVVICEHEGCSEPKREGSGKGAPPKHCEAHSNPKNRK
jgi:hypothetical protein